ncbi:carbamoyltransferase HypF [Escherichia coli]|uniref:carbamoyltransferase HypF n=1 Tax=Enterobacteriaceae TaxID=543 RepID=UPI0003EB0EA9|nr:carbamoyltransferase HypF [Salmonella enterica]EFC6552354.1 carbamoyltransferase HypF [Escherichia coli]MCM7070640.1 carbamoyltransferase HypF [Enterobacter hormaechei]EBB7791868.1 carbamoyltransferase HypF [Salmonella enterica subsp. enterica serovar Senftenberg]EBF7042235.1 carbamoyltransferase HypF [Salmonella enterica subsp. enterica serovar Senftenberg]EFL7416960.1 carbamoyltransferase HypF [Escherichia coli]
MNGVQIRIRGKVQGVGFRPFIWQLAQQSGRSGDVCNDGDGVLVRLLGDEAEFLAELARRCPPLARIDSLHVAPFHWPAVPVDFTIRQSTGGRMRTQIVPDAATCPACLAEMNNPQERRYRYPFINCTHCGPRFTIIRAMPYDRPLTTMAPFPLCPRCEAEYSHPADRRFHAQPVACDACGPRLEWRAKGAVLYGEAALQAAFLQLADGQIVAIKGIGGFHLACDASDPRAVATLRLRKRRPAKPLAVMLPTAAGLAEEARALLASPAAPIVLVDRSLVGGLCADIAPALQDVGVMLPSNPVQHLLLQALARPVVMTSGNLSGRAPAISNADALHDLAGIADGFLLHNRDIVQRMDDSVVRDSGEMLRRSRGYVPDAMPLPPGFHDVPPLLCLGADMKNTFCLVRGEEAVLSQHFGNLNDEAVEEQWHRALSLMQEVYAFTPQWIVADAHPDYRSTRWASSMALPVEHVLHHHAHAAACLGEHGWPLDGGDVIAITLDGIGMGENGSLWGGECLKVNYRECERLGGLPAVALPGGDMAASQPWRNLLAHCLAFVDDWQSYPETVALRQQNWLLVARAIERGINTPKASSCGRLFDAVAYALSCVPGSISYEGEAGAQLEALASRYIDVIHPVTLPWRNGELDLTTFWRQWLCWKAGAGEKAWAFHDALAGGLAEMARGCAEQLGIRTLVFAGGVLHNRLLVSRLKSCLSDFTLLFPQQLPAGDGAIAFGQAVVASARWKDHRLSH